MTANVRLFHPSNGQDIANVPHMLRYWAAQVEAGAMPAHSLVVIAVDRRGTSPLLMGAGAHLTPVELGGLGARLTDLAMGYLR